ncbi:MAG: stage V sporulation protein AC [Anaerovoracaceae bacterium]|jgi:stage V sporulation protein AC
MANNKEQEKALNKLKKENSKEYEKYVKQFTPKPSYFSNCLKAFIVGGLICIAAMYIQNTLLDRGMSETDAGAIVTIILICSAQLLTGFGIFDTIAKFAGAGVIVPITGFANSMVAPAIEFKKEGLVLGVGGKLFTVAGPVLVFGLLAGTAMGIIHYFL